MYDIDQSAHVDGTTASNLLARRMTNAIARRVSAGRAGIRRPAESAFGLRWRRVSPDRTPAPSLLW